MSWTDRHRISRTSSPGSRGFHTAHLFRTRPFYEAYAGADQSVSALLRQIPWTRRLMVLDQARQAEECEFYLPLLGPRGASCRQLKLAWLERAVAQPQKSRQR